MDFTGVPHPTKSGEIRWAEERTFIEADENGVVKYLKGIILILLSESERKSALHSEDLGIASALPAP